LSKRGLLIPDIQAAPGRSLEHLKWLSAYIASKQFDVIIQIGDLGDFTSLSSYDKGKASAENRRLSKDWDAFQRAVDLVEGSWRRSSMYKPRLVYCEGNHEERLRRFANDNPAMDTLPNPVTYMRARGWESHRFLEVAKVEGCLVSHYFPRTLKGTITSTSMKYGAPSAEVMVRANMRSCIAGHKPGYDYKSYSAAYRTYHGLIAGSFYTHNESFMGPQQRYWRGVFALNRLKDGHFDPCPVSIEYLKERYG
jgi:hypothetical protein